MSATRQGISYDDWDGYVGVGGYCISFNDACREKNREKYDRMCLICGRKECDNITSVGKQQKLSVHHVDMNKMQGCEGAAWRLIPVCIHCHASAHNKRMISALEYIVRDMEEQ